MISLAQLCYLLLIAGASAVSDDEAFVVRSDAPLGTVDPREVSVTWDIWAIGHPDTPFNLSDPVVRTLTSHLQPFVLRISGTGCENTQFVGSPQDFVPIPSNVVSLLRPGGGGTKQTNVTADNWEDIADFVKATGADLVMGVNQLVRNYPSDTDKGCNGDKACTWNGANAKAWIEHNAKIGLEVYGYELGNEPGCFMPNINLPGPMAAGDYAALKQLVQAAHAEHVNDTTAPVPKLIGPDVGGCRHANNGNGSLDDILGGNPPFDIIAFHHYVLPGSQKNGHGIYNVENFTYAAASNKTKETIGQYVDVRAAHGMSSVPMWIGEGATTYSQPLDGTFAMLFNYINILGQNGLQGVQLFAKQALPDFFSKAGPLYAHEYEPTADYWCALLWKKLMGVQVIPIDPPVAGARAGSTHVLAYARSTAPGAIRSYSNATTARANANANASASASASASTLVFVNLADVPTSVAVKVKASSCKLYELTPEGGDATSQSALLNGNRLGPTTTPAELLAMGKACNCAQVALSSHSVAFVVAM